ncbi:MAG: YIP1 family protein [Ignavibacteriaceae bacterium]
MDNLTDSTTNPPVDSQPEEELNHSDKMIGIITEPSSTFDKIAKFPLKTIDWLLPAILLFLVICITQVVINSNKAIHSQIVDKQLTKIEAGFDKAVASGKMTADEKAKQMDAIQDRMEAYGPIQIIFTFVGVFIGGFIMFFIMCGIYYLFVKFALKGDGNYNSVLVVRGLTFYIGILNIVVATILTFAFGRMVQDVSVASFLDSDRSSITGFIFAKLDVIGIWGYIVLSIGLAKLFKSSSTLKYYLTVFGIWILGGLLFFLLAKAVPFLSYFGA